MQNEQSLVPHTNGLVKVDNQEKLYTLDEMKEVWYFSMLHGATLWQYCQDTNKTLPDDFNRGLHGLLSKVVTAHDLQEVLKSRALMVGLFDECINELTTNDTVKAVENTDNQETTSFEIVK